ncbi:MAG: hypothetical protein NTNFB02_14340 [Nitrospira sp.]
MDIDQEILIIDDDFDAIPSLQIRQSFGLSHSHGYKSRLSLTRVDPRLSAPDFLYGAKKHPISEEKLGVGLLGTGTGLGDGCSRDPADYEHGLSP